MTAPDESCTTPEIVPVVTWAETRWPLNITLINSTGKYLDIFLSPPHLKISRVNGRGLKPATTSVPEHIAELVVAGFSPRLLASRKFDHFVNILAVVKKRLSLHRGGP